MPDQQRLHDLICRLFGRQIDIPARTITLAVPEAELAQRRAGQDARGWKPPAPRPRPVFTALTVHAQFASSADKGAVRVLPKAHNRAASARHAGGIAFRHARVTL